MRWSLRWTEKKTKRQSPSRRYFDATISFSVWMAGVILCSREEWLSRYKNECDIVSASTPSSMMPTRDAKIITKITLFNRQRFIRRAANENTHGPCCWRNCIEWKQWFLTAFLCHMSQLLFICSVCRWQQHDLWSCESLRSETKPERRVPRPCGETPQMIRMKLLPPWMWELRLLLDDAVAVRGQDGGRWLTDRPNFCELDKLPVRHRPNLRS